jgi:competence protein ComEC
VSSSFGSILLTGDIESKVERHLMKKYRAGLASDILIVPHHGSNTSSTMAFIAAVDPKLSIISAGYRNRYHLPNTKVLARYSRHSTDSDHRLLHTLLQTQSSGAISLVLKGDEIIKFQQFRKQSLKYWHHSVKNNE